MTIAPIISANHKTLHLQILSLCFIHKTVKPAHEITYIKQSPVLKGQICSCPVIENENNQREYIYIYTSEN
jgi:hypothetical protein